MDTSKELTKMIKGVKLGKYYFEKLIKKAKNENVKIRLEEGLKIFDDQLQLLINDASMADYRISIESTKTPPQAKMMLCIKYLMVNKDFTIMHEAARTLHMGAVQTEKFLDYHPNLDENLREQVINIAKQYYDLMNKIQNTEVY